MQTTLPPLPDLRAVNVAELIESRNLDIGNGYSLRLDIESDECFDPFSECDVYGKVEHCDRWSGSQRPAGFDGSAEKIRTDREVYWWLPPRDGKIIYRDCRQTVVELLEYGPVGVVIKLYGPSVSVMGTDTLEIASASLWGFEPSYQPDPETIADLIGELQP